MYNNYNPYNPYYNQMGVQNRYQPMEQIQVPKQAGLLGKSVDSLDTVKGMDISLDGSINYFPLTDGTMIATKQLLQDGTSKILVYKLVEDKIKEVKYVTQEDIDKAIKKIDLSDIKDDIKSLKKQIKDLRDSDD